MRISVVVSNFNGVRFLPRLIDTLRQQQHVTTDIIVVDRHSTDGSLDYLRECSDVRVVSETPATGLVAGYAIGAAVARGDLLFFCNEDMWFDPECLQRLAAQISLPDRVGAADPWQWTYDEASWIHGGTRFYRRRWAITSPYPRRGVDFTVPLARGDRVPFPCAGAFLIHRNVYDEIGGWDTSFFLDHEDVDLFIRAWQHGWDCATVPDAKVYHAVNASNANVLETGRRVFPRRYIANRSNLAVIALKYYSGVALGYAAATLLAPLLSDLFKLRFGKMTLDLQAILLTMTRLGAVRDFRDHNRHWASIRPGLRFFLREDMTLPDDEHRSEGAGVKSVKA